MFAVISVVLTSCSDDPAIPQMRIDPTVTFTCTDFDTSITIHHAARWDGTQWTVEADSVLILNWPAGKILDCCLTAHGSVSQYRTDWAGGDPDAWLRLPSDSMLCPPQPHRVLYFGSYTIQIDVMDSWGTIFRFVLVIVVVQPIAAL